MLLNQAHSIYDRTRTLRERPLIGYAFAVVLVALTLGARFVVAGRGGGLPFLTFIPAVLIVSFLCGWRAGALAAVLALIARYSVLGPATAPFTNGGGSMLSLAMYLFAVLIILGLVAAVHLVFRDFMAHERQRSLLQADLEVRVRDRTLALEAANQQLRDEASSRAAAEDQLRQMQKMEALGQLTGGIAHDFNNMLAIIVGSLDIARRHLDADRHKAETHIEHALDGARRASQLTARLLAFARRQPLDPKPLDANELVKGMSELLRRTLGQTIRLESDLSANLWTTFADASQLESALVNLCANSRDAMPGGGVLALTTCNVTLDGAAARAADLEPGQYVSIAVTDTGAGMTPEVVARAFDPFYTTKKADKGTGLGLSQVYGFVKQSGGHVRIESEPGQGTTVRLYLPRYLGPAELLAGGAREDEDLHGRRENVLVVEDEEKVRRMTVEALKHLGYQVLSAGTPEEGLALLESAEPIDLLLTDIIMPRMSGLTLAIRARELRPELRILYTTGYTPDPETRDALHASGGALLSKPFTIEQLARMVHASLVTPCLGTDEECRTSPDSNVA